MLKSRLALLVFAVIFGISATIVAGVYLKSLEKDIRNSGKLTSVYIAERSIKPGASFRDMLLKRQVSLKQIPKKYVAAGAVSPEKIDGKVLAVPLTKGDQLTVSKFHFSERTGLSLQIPQNMVAVSIAVDEVIGVSNLILPGDYVMIISTFDSAEDGPEVSRILLHRVRVLTTSENKSPNGSKSQSSPAQKGLTKKTITVAVSPAEAEKIAFAQEKGRLFLALLSAKGISGNSTSSGATWDSIFK